jgi:DNA-binding SARP family transcriptional activator
MLPDIDQLLVPDADASDPKGEQQQALDTIQSAIEDAHGTDPARLVLHYFTLSRFHILRSEYSQAIVQIEKALLHPCSPDQLIELFLLQGTCLARAGSLASAEETFLRAADISRKHNHHSGLARSLFLLSSYVLVIRGKFNLALTYIDEAQENFAIAGLKHWGGPWLKTYIYLIMGDLRHARPILFEMGPTIQPAKAIAGAYFYLWSILAIADEEYEQAREYLRLGLRIAMQTGNPELRLWFHLELGRLHRAIHQYPIAREWVEEACIQARRSNLPYFEAATYLELAQIYWLSDECEKASTELHKAVEIYAGLGANYDCAYALFLKAFWSHQHQKPGAELDWNEAAAAIIQGGYAFILEREQEPAFHLTASWLHNGNPQSRRLAEQLLEQLVHVPPKPLRILGLGQFSVWKGRHYIQDKSWQRRRAGELFRFLLIQPNRTASRDTILDTLWPDNDPDSASALFHQATSTLRRLLEPDLPEKFPSRYLINDGEQLSIRLPAGSLVDFELFAVNLRSAISKKQANPIKEALLSYKGVLFPLDQYDDWTVEIRTRLAELHLEGLVTLAALHLEQERFADAFEVVHQVLLLDQWNEDAVLIGMKTHLSLGSAPHALRLYNQLKTTLENDLSILPRADLRNLADTIRSGSNI